MGFCSHVLSANAAIDVVGDATGVSDVRVSANARVSRPVLKPSRLIAWARRSVFALSATIFALPATAGELWCSGKATEVLLDKEGYLLVNVDWRNDWIMLCNTETEWKGVPASVCVKWYGFAAVAVRAGKTTVTHYAQAPVGACRDMPIYGAAPGPYYFRFQTQ